MKMPPNDDRRQGTQNLERVSHFVGRCGLTGAPRTGTRRYPSRSRLPMWQGRYMPSAPDIVAFVEKATRDAIAAVLDYIGSDHGRAADAQELLALAMSSSPELSPSEQFERMAGYDVMSSAAARLPVSDE